MTLMIRPISGGKLELRVSDDPERFKNLADVIQKTLGARWTNQIECFDQAYWDLDVAGMKLTLHREHYLGVSIFSDDTASHRALLEQVQRGLEAS